MADVLLILLTVAAFALVMGLLAWSTRRHRGRRLSSSVAGPFEEIWHPAAHRARIEIETQDERTIAMPSAGDLPGLELGQPRSEAGPVASDPGSSDPSR